jgi:predicted DNA-binding antitoxin AbrB/MazE fold protein
MSIEAIYRHGVFEPLEPVNLPDEQRVQLSIEPAPAQSLKAWIESVRVLQKEIVSRAGTLPDSAAEIAADRLR